MLGVLGGFGAVAPWWRKGASAPDDNFERFNAAYEKGTLTTVNFAKYHHLLEPDAFRSLIRGSSGEPVEPERAYTILRPLLRILQLRRIMAHHILVNDEQI